MRLNLKKRKKTSQKKSEPPAPEREAYAEVGRKVVNGLDEMPTQALADRAVYEDIPETERERAWVANRQNKYRGRKIPP